MSHLLRFSIALGCCLYYCLCFLFQHLLHNREWTRKQQIKPQSITTLSSLPSLPCDQTRENKPEYGTKSELHFFISPRRPLTFTLEVIHDFSIHCEHCNSQLMSSFLRVTLPNATSDMPIAHVCAVLAPSMTSEKTQHTSLVMIGQFIALPGHKTLVLIGYNKPFIG